MGRRGNMRSRPGVLFIIIFAVCLVIVYLSWRSMSPGIKVKDTYSVQMQTLLDESSKWKNVGENREGENHDKENNNREINDRDPDYDLENVHEKKVPPMLGHFEKPDDKENSDKRDFKKRLTDPKTPAAIETNKKEFYREPNDLITATVKSMERLVHLDLKGAAPRMSYFKDFIPLVKKLGATGLLIEYEDMFPFNGKLRYIRAENAYSMDDIKELLDLAKVNKLKVMPLIQTFGHMEFVLKSLFSKLRESSYTPQVIDITQNASYTLISEMVKQILNAHPDATHLHIGCDEVYELGKGASGREMQSKQLTESQLFLRHVQKVADIVRSHNGRNVIPVMWDDELRKTPIQDILNSKLPSMVEIMVWKYTKYVLNITSETWEKYAKLFKSVWIASAFKGATGARQLFTEPQYHIQNHFSWLDAIAKYNQRITFKGIALTGWQRYDHFATLCELLPVAIPSLAVCLATMVNAGFTKEIHRTTTEMIKCNRSIEMTFPQIDEKTERAIVTQDCRFPGHELYFAVQELYGYIEGMPSIKHRLDGWLSDYQIAHQFSSPGQLRVLSKSLTKQNSGLVMVSNPLKRLLSDIYFDDTVDEWMDENIIERQKHNTELQEKIQSLALSQSWPQRPLPVGPDYNKRSRLNKTGDNNFQNSQVDQSKNAQAVQNYLRNRNAEYQSKQDVKNRPYIKPTPELQYKQDPKPESPLSGPFNPIFQNEQKEPKETEKRDFVAGNQDLPEPSKEEQSVNRKRSNVFLESENRKSKKSNSNQKQQSNKNDGSRRGTVDDQPDIQKPPVVGISKQQMPDSDNLRVNSEPGGDGKIGRERYFPMDKKEPQRGKPDNDFSSFKERFNGKVDNGKEM